MKIFLLLAAVSLSTPVQAGGCDDETIRRVARGGSIIMLDSGGIYEVAPDDIADTALWSAGDSVLVCGGEIMINQDNGDTVHVAPQR